MARAGRILPRWRGVVWLPACWPQERRDVQAEGRVVPHTSCVCQEGVSIPRDA